MPSPQFLRLAPEQQARILGASLAAFADSGYEGASTNRIVREARISKGVLFKYFADKEALFLYVVEQSTRAYLQGLPGAERDMSVFDWIRLVTVYKLRYIQESPRAYRLFARMLKDPGHPAYARALRAQAHQMKRFGRTDPPWTCAGLRPGIEQRHVLNLLQWIATGLQEQFAERLPDVVGEELDAAYHAIVAEFDVYLDIVQSGLYGEERP